MARLTIENLSRRFTGRDGQETWAVRDLNLEVQAGQLLVLLGPSGCGKTTTLRCIAGLDQPQTGRILLGGEPITHLPPERRDVAMVFQSRALFPHLTVYENLAIGLKLREMAAAEIEGRVAAAAAMLGLQGLLGRLPEALSGGEQQRVALGRALVRQPRLFLLDEPLSQLDLRLREQLRGDIQKIRQRTTMVYVTHDQFEAMALGEVVAVMKDGTLQQVGAPRALYERPANLFVAGFIGWPAMNLFRAKLALENGKLVLGLAEGTGLTVAGVGAGLDQWLGRTVWVGVRPEKVRVNLGAGAGQIAEVMVSPAGQDFVRVKLGGELLVAAAPPSVRCHAGESCGLELDFAELRFFDPDTEKTIG